MKKLEEIDRLVEEALKTIFKDSLYSPSAKISDESVRPILTSLARKCAEIDVSDLVTECCGIVDRYNSSLRDGQVEEVKQEEKPSLQPLPEEKPNWFLVGQGDYGRQQYNLLRQHFGTPPREWWMDLKKGDKFVYDNGVDGEVKIFRGIIYLAAKEPEICNLSKCSPYTDPTQSFRSKLTPEMQVEFDKVIETINNTPQP